MVICRFGNNEDYYSATLWEGIPDGDDIPTVLKDLKDGFYDEYIDDAISMYRNVRKHYEKDGFYYNKNVYVSAETCIDAAGIQLPTKILKNKIVY